MTQIVLNIVTINPIMFNNVTSDLLYLTHIAWHGTLQGSTGVNCLTSVSFLNNGSSKEKIFLQFIDVIVFVALSK